MRAAFVKVVDAMVALGKRQTRVPVVVGDTPGFLVNLGGTAIGTEGLRIGLWGAAQALAFAGGGLVGTGASDLARWLLADVGSAYAIVFGLEALLFLCAAQLAAGVEARARAPAPAAEPVGLHALVQPAGGRASP